MWWVMTAMAYIYVYGLIWAIAAFLIKAWELLKDN